MKKKLFNALLLGMLAGCGSDDTSESPDIPKPEKPDYLTLDIKPEAKFSGQFSVNLGVYPDPLKKWFQSENAKDLNQDGHIDERDALLAGVVNQEHPLILVDAAKMHQVLKTDPDGLGAGSARSDIFVDGQYSVFDVLRYLAFTRDDLVLDEIISPEQSGRDTFEFKVSWDCNGDGNFSETDNESADPANVFGCGVNYSNLKSPDWHFQFNFNGGNFTRAGGSLSGFSPAGEGNYERMDQFWVKPGMNIRLQSFSAEMTGRRHWVQGREMARLAENSGKVVIPQLFIIASKDNSKIITDLEVSPHNMRPDIFQPGVITKMDVLLSAADGGTDIAFTYWPSLSTGANVGHFALFLAIGVSGEGARGWNTYNGEFAIQDDFSPFSQCDFSSEAAGSQDIVVDPEHCRQDWQFIFGGDHLHQMSDVWVMNQPVEFVKVSIGSHYPAWGMTEYSGKTIAERDFSKEKDGSDIMTLQVFTLPEDDEGPLLQPTHFGWGIADCTECHNEVKDPLGHGGHSWPINSSDGFDQSQPYYCTTCHGSNGAPEGHGATARCFWCHDSESNRPVHHGEASTQRLYRGDEIEGNTHIHTHPVVNALPKDKMGNVSEYKEVWNSVNSDWDMSQIFPDPYSCITCHPNQQPKL